MPYLISNLMQGRREPVTAKLDTPISQALQQMVDNDYSQLPVVDELNRPLGMITNQSILGALSNFGVRLEELRITDAMIKVDCFRAEDDLFDVLSRLQENNAVLIVDDERRVIGILTDWDSMAYFQRRAEDMMLIEDIEVMLRNIVQSVYTDESGQIDEQRVREIAKEIDIVNRSFDRFSMSDIVALFLHEDSWSKYGWRFALPPGAIKGLFDNVRRTRNQLAHFRGETTAQQRQQLRFCAEWLLRYHDPIVSEHHGVVKIEVEVKDVPVALPQGERDEEALAPGMSRYARLAIWLANRPPDQDTVTLTFDQVEAIIEGDLPASAYKHRAWWANDSVSHPHSQQWLEVGWRAASANMSDQHVRFSRIKERQRAYIDFYSLLIGDLRKQPGFESLYAAPDGVNWYYVRAAAIGAQSIGLFAFSLGMGGVFRIELYIDTGEQEKNKKIFDALSEQQEEIETVLGEHLRWERLDDKRASRISRTLEGKITDDEEKLGELRKQAVPAMVEFIAEMQPRLQSLQRP